VSKAQLAYKGQQAQTEQAVQLVPQAVQVQPGKLAQPVYVA
jgi:hypothetical protein